MFVEVIPQPLFASTYWESILGLLRYTAMGTMMDKARSWMCTVLAAVK